MRLTGIHRFLEIYRLPITVSRFLCHSVLVFLLLVGASACGGGGGSSGGGAAPAAIDVPDVTGDPTSEVTGTLQGTAEGTLLAAGLSVGTVTSQSSETVPAGYVISQSPVPCTACAASGDAVDLVVSSGPELVDSDGAVTIDPSIFAAGTNVSNAYPNAKLSTAQVTAEINELDVVTPLQLISDATGPVFTNGSTFLTDAGSELWAADVRFGDDALRVDILTARTSISATIVPDDTDTAVLQIYDSSGTLLAETIDRSSSEFVLSLTAPVNSTIAFALVAPIDGAEIKQIVIR